MHTLMQEMQRHSITRDATHAASRTTIYQSYMQIAQHIYRGGGQRLHREFACTD